MRLRPRVRPRVRHLTGAAIIATLALTLVGCANKSGSGGQGASGGSGSKKFAPLTLNPSQVVAASATKTLLAGSAKMSMTTEVTATTPTTKTTAIRADGAFNFAKHQGTLVFHFPQLGDVQAVFVNSVVYERLGALLKTGKPWIRIDLTKLLGKGANLSSADQTGGDPSQSLAYLFGASGVTKIGSDSIRGATTTHYRGTLDLTKATQKLSPQFQAFYQKLLQSTGTKVTSGIPSDLWIDGQGRLRRMSYTVKVTTSTLSASTTKSTIDYYAFGTPVSVQVPPADQVTSLGG